MPIMAFITDTLEFTQTIIPEAECDKFVVKSFQPETFFEIMRKHVGAQ